MKPCLTILAGILLLGARGAYGAGMLIPREDSIPPLALESQRVDIRIKDGSEEYFKLPKEKPELKDFLVLGTKGTIVLEDGTALVVE